MPSFYYCGIIAAISSDVLSDFAPNISGVVKYNACSRVTAGEIPTSFAPDVFLKSLRSEPSPTEIQAPTPISSAFCGVELAGTLLGRFPSHLYYSLVLVSRNI